MNRSRPVDKTEICETQVGRPAVRGDHGPWGHCLPHESEQAVLGGVWNALQPYAAEPSLAFCLYSDDYECLCLPEFSSTFPFFDTPNEDFIHLYLAPQTISPWADHGAPQLVKTGPRRFVAPKSQYPLETRSAHAVFLVGESPHCSEPHTQWDMAPVEDGPRCHRDISSTSTATQESTSLFPSFSVATTPTLEPIRPIVRGPDRSGRPRP